MGGEAPRDGEMSLNRAVLPCVASLAIGVACQAPVQRSTPLAVATPNDAGLDRDAFEALAPLCGTYASGELGQYVLARIEDGRLVLDLPGIATTKPDGPDASGLWRFAPPSKTAVRFGKIGEPARDGLELVEGEKRHAFTRVVRSPDWPGTDELLAWRRAKQGGAKVDELASVRMEGMLDLPRTKQTGESRIAVASKDRWISRTTIAGMPQTSLFDGEHAWSRAGTKPREELQEPYAEQTRLANPLLRIRDWRESFVEVDVIDKLALDGEPCWIVRCKPRLGPPWIRWVSCASGLVLFDQGWIQVKGMPMVPNTLRYLDYRPVGGVPMPFRIERENALSGPLTIVYTSIEANPTLAPGELELD